MVSIKPFKVSTGQIEFSPEGFSRFDLSRPPEGSSDCRVREMAERRIVGGESGSIIVRGFHYVCTGVV